MTKWVSCWFISLQLCRSLSVHAHGSFSACLRENQLRAHSSGRSVRGWCDVCPPLVPKMKQDQSFVFYGNHLGNLVSRRLSTPVFLGCAVICLTRSALSHTATVDQRPLSSGKCLIVLLCASDLVRILVRTSSMRRFGLVAELVDVKTDNCVSMATEHWEFPVVKWNAEPLDLYSQDVPRFVTA